jgi:hypothetical protein
MEKLLRVNAHAAELTRSEKGQAKEPEESAEPVRPWHYPAITRRSCRDRLNLVHL